MLQASCATCRDAVGIEAGMMSLCIFSYETKYIAILRFYQPLPHGFEVFGVIGRSFMILISIL
jgi:hypothetical protein